ncbi:MAG: glutamate racemase [Ruminococcus sp.]|nr:glutamate racemase [Ruminococcus sp.]
MIGIFDSGIGGVTVLKEILKILPNYKYLYYSDSLNNPYGDKTKEELLEITKSIVDFLIYKGAKIIVIACNTASAICKEYLRREFDIPIIAIEPAYKVVNDYYSDGKTLIMATKGTLESKAFSNLFHKYDNKKTKLYECVGLADLIEVGNKKLIKKFLNENISEFKGVENVILGCTHYPLIKKELREVLGDVNFIDGSVGVARELKRKLELNVLSDCKGEIIFIDSSNDSFKEKRFREILKN